MVPCAEVICRPPCVESSVRSYSARCAASGTDTFGGGGGGEAPPISKPPGSSRTSARRTATRMNETPSRFGSAQDSGPRRAAPAITVTPAITLTPAIAATSGRAASKQNRGGRSTGLARPGPARPRPFGVRPFVHGIAWARPEVPASFRPRPAKFHPVWPGPARTRLARVRLARARLALARLALARLALARLARARPPRARLTRPHPTGPRVANSHPDRPLLASPGPARSGPGNKAEPRHIPRRTATTRRIGRQLLLHRRQFCPGQHQPGAARRLPRAPREVGMQGDDLAAIGEVRAVASSEPGLRRHAVGQHDVVLGQ